ncbi:MAG: trigger factor [Lachnospiraceae bacterium]
MKKHIVMAALLLSLSLAAAGCGGSSAKTDGSAAETGDAAGTSQAAQESESGEASEITDRGEYTAEDYCDIKDYIGIEIAKDLVTPSEEDIQAEIDDFLSNLAENEEVDRAIENGDIAYIDFTGYIDGETFEGGTGTDYDLLIGSHSFISGFEEGLIGAKKGEKRSLDLTFPDPYPNNPDLAGVPVTFEVTVKKVCEEVVPEFTDEVCAANTDYKTKEDYRQSVIDELHDSMLSSEFMKAVFAKAEFTGEYPESLRNYYYGQYESMLYSYYGEETVASVLGDYNNDMKTMIESIFGETIENYMKADMLMEVVAHKEGITADGDAYQAYIDEQAESTGLSADELLSTYGETNIAFGYITDSAYKLMYDSLVIK